MTDRKGYGDRFRRWTSKHFTPTLLRAIASCLSASRAMVRPGLLVFLLAGLVPLYLIVIQSELHATSPLPTFSVVNVTPCVTTTAGTDLSCPVTYTAGNSLVLNLTLDTGSLTFETPQSVSDGVNDWVADTLSGGVTCQSDNNSGGSDCYYHANSIAGTSATVTVALPTGSPVGYVAAYIYEISGGPLTEDVAASQGYPDNPYSETVDTPLSGTLAGSTDIVFGSAAADWPDGTQPTLGSGPTNGYTGEPFLNAGGQAAFSTNLLSAYLIPGSSSSTSTSWTVSGNSGVWANAIIAYEPAAGAPTATPTATGGATATATATATKTATSTPTATGAATRTATSTATPTTTATATVTATLTSTPTATATATASGTSTLTATATPTRTATSTASATQTSTSTATATASPTATATRTATSTATPTSTATVTPTTSRTATATPTSTATSTATVTSTATASATTTTTSTATATATATGTPTLSATATSTATRTATSTATPTTTSTATATPTATGTPTATQTATSTTTATRTATATATATPTATATATTTSTSTQTATSTDTATPTATATATSTATQTATPTPTPTPVPVRLKISPASLNFGTVRVGSHKGPKTVTVSNPKGSKNRPGFTVLMQGVSRAGDLFSTMNGCNGPLPAGGTCKVAVMFAPTATGPFNATLTIIDNAQNAPQSVKLKGKGK